jgi:glutaredoxin
MKFKRLIAIALSFILGAGLVFSSYSQEAVVAHAEEVIVYDINLYFFSTPGCGHCAKLKTYLNEKIEEMDNLHITEFDTSISENMDLLQETASVFDASVTAPFTVVGGKYFIGFSDSIKEQLNRVLERYSENEHVDIMAKIINGIEIEESDFDTTSDFEYDIPWIGTVDVRDISLGLLAIVLGFLDGINPCAMWVLLFLITLVLGSKSKKRIWAIGGVFLLTSGIFYFLMMTAWIETVQLLVNYAVFQYIVGALAVVAGGFNLYSFIKAQIKKEDGCKVTNVTTKQKLINKMKKIATASSLPLALLGVVGLAIIVNIIELACSTGFPFMFTQILALNGYTGMSAIGLIILYVFFFLIDDLIVFGIAVVTLKVSPLSSKIGKYAHLIGGLIMLLIGILMIFAPEILRFSFI